MYSGLTAKVLINGHLGKIIQILRGVKQGDALSCAIFIICIDPLLRHINLDREIKPIKILSKITKIDVYYKGGAFVDDVGVLCGGDLNSVQRVFTQYEKLSKRSGLELNAEKMEILCLTTGQVNIFTVNYNGQHVTLKSINFFLY